MNWLQSVEREAFLDEMNKLAAKCKSKMVKRAVITKLADIEPDDEGGKGIIYRSRADAKQDNNKMNRNNYEAYTEDTASGNMVPQTQPSAN